MGGNKKRNIMVWFWDGFSFRKICPFRPCIDNSKQFSWQIFMMTRKGKGKFKEQWKIANIENIVVNIFVISTKAVTDTKSQKEYAW